MDVFKIWGIAGLAGFLLVSVLIGSLALRRVKKTADFFVGGQQMGIWTVAFTYGATAYSSASFVGGAAIGYMWGAGIFWESTSFLILGTIGLWLLMGKRLRRMSARLGAFTFSELLAKRYQTPILQPATAGIVFLAMLLYTTTVLMGVGFLFEVIFKIPYIWGMVLMVAIVGFYLAAGGVVSTMWNCVFQALLMAGGVVVLVAVFIPHVGFISAYEAMGSTRGLEYISFPGVGGALVPMRMLYIGLFPFAMPHTLHQFITMKNSDVIRKALPIIVIWSLIVSFGLKICFTLSYEVLGSGIYPDKVMPMLMLNLLSAPLAAWVMVAVLAASVSTMAGLTLQGAFAIGKDIYQARFRPKTSDLTILRIARVLCVSIAVLALWLANLRVDLIVWVMGITMAICIGSFMAQMVLGLYWRRGTGTAALWAMFLGFVITVVWAAVFGLKGEHLYNIHPALPAVVVNWTTFVVVSRLSKPLPKEHLDRVFGTGELVTPDFTQIDA